MRKGLTKLHYLLFVLLLLAMAGCGANNAGTTAGATSGSALGGISAKLQWQQAGSAKRALAAVAPAGVANLQFTVSGSGSNGAIPVVKASVAADATQGQVGGIYPGTVAVAVKAVDNTGKTLYEGYAVNVAVTAGNTTDVGVINMSAPIVKAEETPCLGCHETALDATGQNIVANYKQSGHYTNTSFADANGKGAGCVGCHGASHNNPDPSANGTASRCFECHNLNGAAAGIVAEHGDAATNATYLANGTACTACHQVHNTKAANMERKTWAQSGHGAQDIAGINHNSGSCVRCHNPKGFIAALANPTAPTSMTAVQQQITCDACHTNAALGKLRALAGTTGNPFATYTTSTLGYQFAPNNKLNPNKKAYFPDVAGSNLCVVCHSGTREGSATALAASDPYFVNYSTMKTVAPHNLPAAAVMYVKFGFTNLSTGAAGVPSAAYLKTLTSDLDGGSVTSTHRKFGTSAITADSHFSASHPAPALLKVNGPCATCHLGGSHSLKIDQAAINAVCSNCHTSENGLDISTEASFLANFVEPQQEVYNNAFQLAAAILNQKVAAAGLTNVIFYTNPTSGKFTIGNNVPSTTTAGTYGSYTGDLRALAVALGYSSAVNHNTATVNLGQQKFIGALSNLIFLSEDQGGFAHARTYVRRLIYDSIDFLDDGSLNMSAGTSAVNIAKVASFTSGVTNPVYNLYKKGTAAYSDGTLKTLASGTSESMLFLIGWNRTTGGWVAPERP